NGYKKEDETIELKYGPNIKEWPEMEKLSDNILLKICAKIMDEVTTTDELIPSGETSSYRSNPLGLAEFTLSRRVHEYVSRSKEVRELEKNRLEKNISDELQEVLTKINTISLDKNIGLEDIQIGSMIYAIKPGDGSAREQAASCQKVLGGLANISKEYATKRYRSNLINWGMIPFQMKNEVNFEVNDYIYVPNIRTILDGDLENIEAYIIGEDIKKINLYIDSLTSDERKIIKAGCLINFNKK
ncbi:MAG: hydratase, partial [Fusobacterium sp. JB021]|nr:hydratase [Fusobacterium sp. JB021]